MDSQLLRNLIIYIPTARLHVHKFLFLVVDFLSLCMCLLHNLNNLSCFLKAWQMSYIDPSLYPGLHISL